jgi:hypothetical protein
VWPVDLASERERDRVRGVGRGAGGGGGEMERIVDGPKINGDCNEDGFARSI